MNYLPHDPVMLMSLINMKMRDEHDSLEEFCAANGLDEARLKKQIEAAGFIWNSEIKQFR